MGNRNNIEIFLYSWRALLDCRWYQPDQRIFILGRLLVLTPHRSIDIRQMAPLRRFELWRFFSWTSIRKSQGTKEKLLYGIKTQTYKRRYDLMKIKTVTFHTRRFSFDAKYSNSQADIRENRNWEQREHYYQRYETLAVFFCRRFWFLCIYTHSGNYFTHRIFIMCHHYIRIRILFTLQLC